ncbi:MAG: glycosyltransferase family 2 protein [Nitrospirae bacterium]|nr:glycosyltransferase family 2 protein [Nitrospirota bacterium]
MKASLIIACYNYEQYVDRAITSALKQTRKFDEIIFVDDGSVDSSYARAKAYKEVSAVTKKNGGLLSVIRAGFQQSSGDIICLLDCDDELLDDHLENVMSDMNSLKIGMRFNNSLLAIAGKKPKPRDPFRSTAYWGPTPVATYYAHWGLGANTSCLAFDREVLKMILHYNEGLDHYWRIRGEDTLIWGSSLLGATKYYSEKPTTIYHIHDRNSFYGKKATPIDSAFYEHSRDIFFSRFSPIFADKRKPHKQLISELKCHNYIDSNIVEIYNGALKRMRTKISSLDYIKTKIRLKMLSNKLLQQSADRYSM